MGPQVTALISGLNIPFIKRGEPEIDTRTSSSERERNCGPENFYLRDYYEKKMEFERVHI